MPFDKVRDLRPLRLNMAYHASEWPCVLKKVHFINQVGEMDTNTVRDLTQRTLSSSLIRLSSY